MVGAPFQRSGLAVIQPHLLLGIDEYEVPSLKGFSHLFLEVLRHIAAVLAYRNQVGVTEEKTFPSGHQEVCVLTYHPKRPAMHLRCHPSDNHTLEGGEVVAGHYRRSLQPSDVFQANYLRMGRIFEGHQVHASPGYKTFQLISQGLVSGQYSF